MIARTRPLIDIRCGSRAVERLDCFIKRRPIYWLVMECVSVDGWRIGRTAGIAESTMVVPVTIFRSVIRSRLLRSTRSHLSFLPLLYRQARLCFSTGSMHVREGCERRHLPRLRCLRLVERALCVVRCCHPQLNLLATQVERPRD